MTTREAIIDAAVLLFNEKGYHATSMRAIAEQVEIEKPSLYHHFNSKEDILLAILEIGMTHLIKELERIVALEIDPISKLRRAIGAHARIIAENPQGAAVFLREDRGLSDSYLREYVLKRDHFESLFRKILIQGIEEGCFRAVDVTIAVQAV
ncbi:MAG: TetR/AcrR family transcriptional regulator, partial [Anaerolineae bacterium]